MEDGQGRALGSGSIPDASASLICRRTTGEAGCMAVYGATYAAKASRIIPWGKQSPFGVPPPIHFYFHKAPG